MTRYFRTRTTVVHEQFGDETVIVNLDTGSYFSAEGTGDVIWALAMSGMSEDEIKNRICAEYLGDSVEISKTITEFLDQIVVEGLADPDSHSNGVVSTSAKGAKTSPAKTFQLPTLQKYTDMEELLALDPIHEVDEDGWPSARKVPT